MSYELTGADASFPAAADLTGKQFYAVTLDSSSQAALCSAVGQKALGILQNEPTALGHAATVRVRDISKAIAGGTVTAWDPVGPDASGKLVTMDEDDEAVLGRCLVASSVDEKFPLLITHEGSAAALQDTVALIASANYAVTGQYLAVKPHSTAGQFIKIAAANDNIMGVLQNAPAQNTVGNIKIQGVTTITAGTGDLAAGDRLQVDSSGQFTTATGGPACGFSLAAILDGATGLGFLMPQWQIDMVGSALASAKMFVGSAGGLAAAVDLSGDVTVDNTGVVTIGAEKVGVAKMLSAAQGTLHRGDAAAAVSELDAKTAGQIVMGDGVDVVSLAVSGDVGIDGTGDTEVSDLTMATEARGDIIRRGATVWEVLDASTVDQVLVGDGSDLVSVPMSGDVAIDATGDTEVSDLTMATEARGDIVRRGATNWEVLDASTDGQIIVGDGNDPQVVPLSGDVALLNTGAVTLAKGFMRQITTNWSAAEIINGDAVPLVLADFSALVTAGIVVSGDALIFHHLIANIYGGAAPYDQNENSIIKYQTAGGGADVSLTLANWFNGAGADTLTDIKQLATVVVPDIDEDLVWTMSASPFAAGGDRLLRVTLYYSVFTSA